jgi:hypothetical protein
MAYVGGPEAGGGRGSCSQFAGNRSLMGSLCVQGTDVTGPEVIMAVNINITVFWDVT